jgi:hypothetical protein
MASMTKAQRDSWQGLLRRAFTNDALMAEMRETLDLRNKSAEDFELIGLMREELDHRGLMLDQPVAPDVELPDTDDYEENLHTNPWDVRDDDELDEPTPICRCEDYPCCGH